MFIILRLQCNFYFNQCNEQSNILILYLSISIVKSKLFFLDSFLPKNMEELQAKVGEIPGKVMTQVGEVTEKCVLQ